MARGNQSHALLPWSAEALLGSCVIRVAFVVLLSGKPSKLPLGVLSIISGLMLLRGLLASSSLALIDPLCTSFIPMLPRDDLCICSYGAIEFLGLWFRHSEAIEPRGLLWGLRSTSSMFVMLPRGLLDELGTKEWRGLRLGIGFPFSDIKEVLELVNGAILLRGLLLCVTSGTSEFRGLNGASGTKECREPYNMSGANPWSGTKLFRGLRPPFRGPL